MKCAKCGKSATRMIAIDTKQFGYAKHVMEYEFRCNDKKCR